MMKDKKDKGFTLIELLAVIVILAIIALIAIPIVLNIINSANESSKIRSKELYLKAVDEAIARKNLTSNFNPSECTVNKNGNITCDEIELVIEVKGEKPCKGTITYENGKRLSESVAYCSGDNTLEEVKEAVSFESDDWATIAGNVRKGNISKYTVGSTKVITLNIDGKEKQYTLRIANTSKDALCGTDEFSETACGFVVEFKDVITTYQMNDTDASIGGWPGSKMHDYVNETIYDALPDDLKEVIIDTRVISGHGSDDKGTAANDNFESLDKLYLLSPHEVYGEGISDDSAWNNTRQLDYYSDVANVITTNYSGAKKALDGSDTDWWLRSASSYGFFLYYIVTSDGFFSYDFSANSHGVAPAFRIG